MGTAEMVESKEASASYGINAAPQEVTPMTNESHTNRKRSNWSSGVFCMSVGLLEIIGITCLCLVSVWTADYMSGEGFAWKRDPDKQFKYHPLFMVLGLVFLYGNGIIVYRMFADVKKMYLKIIHAILHGGAFIFAVIALVAVFDYHYYFRYPDLYSIHSWIGIITVALFALQYTIGFLVFLFPFTPMEARAKLMPFHIFFGILLFATSIAACLTGINEKLVFAGNYSALEKGAVIGNVLGIMLLVFATLVAFVATSSRFKRMPLPEEMNLKNTYSPQQGRTKADSRTSL